MSKETAPFGRTVQPRDGLYENTTQIRTELGTGTGFFFMFKGLRRWEPALITNKHVIAGARSALITFTLGRPDGGGAIPGKGMDLRFELAELRVVPHPDPMIDLVAIFIADLLMFVESKHVGGACFTTLYPRDVATEEFMRSLGPVPTVTVIGYPKGLVDRHNNAPIFRQGITATPLRNDFDNRPEFLVDVPIFPGSSGSPVVYLDDRPNGSLTLLGVVYQNFTYQEDGEIIARSAPVQFDKAVRFSQLLNLGACVKARKVLDLAPELHGF